MIGGVKNAYVEKGIWLQSSGQMSSMALWLWGWRVAGQGVKVRKTSYSELSNITIPMMLIPWSLFDKIASKEFMEEAPQMGDLWLQNTNMLTGPEIET